MDTHVKRGEVHLQHQKHFEKWKRYWLSVYPDSGHGVARLELAEAGSNRSPVPIRRQPDRRVIRAAEVVSVLRLPPHAEACPADNMAAFCVATAERTLVFAVEKDECGDWVEKICDVAFQKSKTTAPVMEKNEIYASREEGFEFRVSVVQSEPSELCSLQGPYCLLVAEEKLVLKNADSRQVVTEWPYKLLRRYGCDKTTFSIEAGRRCESGPGTVQFDTEQGDRIHRLMERSIQQQKNLTANSFSPFSPLPQVPSIDSLLDTLDPVPGPVPGPSGPCGDSGASGATQRYSLESVCLPKAGVYSEPVDAIGPPPPEPVYSVPFEPRGRAEPIYAEVLHVGPRPRVEGGRATGPDVVYSRVCKVRDAAGPREKVTSEDLGLI